MPQTLMKKSASNWLSRSNLQNIIQLISCLVQQVPAFAKYLPAISYPDYYWLVEKNRIEAFSDGVLVIIITLCLNAATLRGKI